ncbi:choice-of-anchor J domain-containing protein [Bacteroides sp.]
MKKNLFMPAVALLLLSGCNYNEENFKGLEEMTQPENVINVDYTLTAEDYKTFDKKSGPYLDSYFSSTEEADELFPEWLAKKYYTASPTSVVRVTFNYMDAASELLKPYTDIPYIGLEKNEDYVPFYGAGFYAPYLNSTSVAEIGSKLLEPKYPNAKKGDLVMVGYNYNATAVPQQIETPVVNYDFDALPKGDITSISGGWYLKAPEEKLWNASNYKGNGYVQYSAKGTTGACEAWLVTPAVKVEGIDKSLGFDITIGYWNADCLTILISTDFDGKDVAKAKWDDITSAYAPTAADKLTDKYGKAVSTKVSLAAYADKTVRVAFKYVGDGANKKTTTYQIDNVVIGKDIPKAVTTTPQFKLFEYNSSKEWKEFANSKTNKVLCPLYTDYTEMGKPGEAMYFSSTVQPENYIPTYLNSWTQYPQNGDARVVIYRYYNADKKLEAQAKQYVYSAGAGRWEYDTQIVEKTRQYAFDGSVWLFDPSTTVTLKADKADKTTSAFYQVITDWVKANKGAEYVTSFGNNDYYYGGSAYNNNFDFRPSAWRAQNVTAYGEKSDDDLKKLMQERLPEAFVPGLEATYPNAEPVEGVNVIYTVNFSIYDGSATTPWTIKYEVKEKGKFTYVDNSLAEVKQ